jgi:hypothetical protein
MTNEIAPEMVYMGLLEDMIAEVAAFDPRAIGITPRECKWLVMPYGAAQFDTFWHSNRADALADAREIAAFYKIKIASV